MVYIYGSDGVVVVGYICCVSIDLPLVHNYIFLTTHPRIVPFSYTGHDE